MFVAELLTDNCMKLVAIITLISYHCSKITQVGHDTQECFSVYTTLVNVFHRLCTRYI